MAPHEIEGNPAMEALGRNLVGSLIRWAEEMDNSNQSLDADGPAGTMVSNDKFRFDKQGEITVHGVQWYNLQVQYRYDTMYTIYVQKKAYQKGLITDRSIHNHNIKAAHRGYPDQTLYYCKESPKAMTRARCAPHQISADDIDTSL